MTTISAKIIADSISPEKIRITTLQLRYPRFIHAELMTHRVFSRNASSSRAVPVEKLIADIKKDTAMPRHWGKNQKGMQAETECNEWVECEVSNDGIHWVIGSTTREDRWAMARDNAIEAALAFHQAGYHKQIVNRLLEPFSHINVVVTSTYWDNWFHLRDHKDAMPEICILAQQIKYARNESTPVLLQPGEWHLPYINQNDYDYVSIDGNNVKPLKGAVFQTEKLIKCSVARCARVSYLTTEGKPPNTEDDLKLYDRLVGSEPLHASPAEHQATPDEYLFQSPKIWMNQKEHGNFLGWRQYRKMLKGEFINDYDKQDDVERHAEGFVY